jgi:dienelactone hydrolase
MLLTAAVAFAGQNYRVNPEPATGYFASIPAAYQAGPEETFFYQHDGLKLEAYLFRPSGPGPFPLVIYNHGSRVDHEREERKVKFIADLLTPKGYAVLVPERRGYGQSEGKTYSETVGTDLGQVMIQRFRNEASDVIAALDHLKQTESQTPSGPLQPQRVKGTIDFTRVAIMGASHGGIMTVLVASQRHDFAAVVNEAGGSLTWRASPALQTAMIEAGGKIKNPTLCLDAQNDATTESVKKTCQAVKAAGTFEKTIIYPAFTPTSNPDNIAPGHLIFGDQGVSLWQQDLFDFLQPRLVRNVPLQPPLVHN